MDSLKKPQLIGHIEKSLDYSIFCVKWIPCTAKFVVLGSKANGNGILQIYELNSGNIDLVKVTEKQSSFKCGSFGISPLRQSHLAVGDFDGKLQILDMERLDYPVYTVQAHTGIINDLDAIGGSSLSIGAPEIVTAGKDGTVKIWDPRQSTDPVMCISSDATHPNNVKMTGNSQSRDCWCATFGNSYNNMERICCAGYDNGDLKMFDMRAVEQCWETNVKNGICSMEFDRKDIKMNKLAITTLEGGLHVYDVRTKHPEKGFAYASELDAGRSVGSNGVISGRKATVWCIKHLPQNRDVFITGGGTGSIRLWQYRYPSKRVKVIDGKDIGVAGSIEMLQATTLSAQPVNSFDWSPDRIGLAVCSAFDQTVRVIVTTKLNLL